MFLVWVIPVKILKKSTPINVMEKLTPRFGIWKNFRVSLIGMKGGVCALVREGEV
jgi:hypothetical protein